MSLKTILIIQQVEGPLALSLSQHLLLVTYFDAIWRFFIFSGIAIPLSNRSTDSKEMGQEECGDASRRTQVTINISFLYEIRNGWFSSLPSLQLPGKRGATSRSQPLLCQGLNLARCRTRWPHSSKALKQHA